MPDHLTAEPDDAEVADRAGPADPADRDPVLGRPPLPPTWRERIQDAIAAGRGAWAARAPMAVTGVALVVALAVLVAVGVAGVAVLRRQSVPPPEIALPLAGSDAEPSSSTSSTTAPALVVHAAGAVAHPGVYRIPSGSRVADLLDAAGGPAPGADTDRLNLAAPLADGDRVYVPRIGEQGTPAAVGPDRSGSGAAGDPAADDGPVDVNTATAAELDELPGIGPATATAIIRYREEHGPFASVEQLLDVPGIGEAKLAQLRPLVTV